MILWPRAQRARETALRAATHPSTREPTHAPTHAPTQHSAPFAARVASTRSSLMQGEPSPHQCDAEALLAYLQRLTARQRPSERDNPGFAVFFIALRRSDRTQALAGLDAARAAITTVCARLAGILRASDRFALFGVDEILLVLPEVDTPGRAVLVASRLVQTLQQPMTSLLVQTRVRPSVGCAVYPAHGNDAEALIAAADAASEGARTSDEGYRIAARSERALETANLSSDLDAALGANQLEVWLQPQLDLRSGRFDAAEALIRWPRPESLPPVSPATTVELAEAHGLMPRLTLFVLNTVLRQSAQFAARGITMRIAINVSASMLSDPNLPLTVRHALELWDVPPERLTLEVTENTLMRDVERSLAILHELKAFGAHLSLDDFGTGYSSFAYLRRMPLDELKIDQLFVRNISRMPDGTLNPQRAGDLRIVRSIIDIAHNFDLRTVAEGVEDEETLTLLKNLGCDSIQGYFTGRPMPMSAVEPWWKAHAAPLGDAG